MNTISGRVAKALGFVGAVAGTAALVATVNGPSASAVGTDRHTELAFRGGSTNVRCGNVPAVVLGSFATGTYTKVRVFARVPAAWPTVTLTFSLVEDTESWDVGKLEVSTGTTPMLALDLPGRTLRVTASCAANSINPTARIDVIAWGN